MANGLLAPILAANTFILSFWPGPSVAKDPRVVAVRDHPCGRIVEARVTTIPSASRRAPLISEIVFEVTPSGSVTHSWRMPVDGYPVATAGERLLFRVGALKLWVGPSGALSRYTGTEPIPQAISVRCNTATKSSYTTCLALPDIDSGKTRTIRFESLCT